MCAYLPKMLVIGTQIFWHTTRKKIHEDGEGHIKTKNITDHFENKTEILVQKFKEKSGNTILRNVELTVVSRQTAAIPCTKCLV